MKKSIHKATYDKIIQKLKTARLEAGLKQETVADILDKYQSYVSKIEHGDRRIDVVELLELAQLYKKDLSYFINDTKSNKER